MNVTGRASIACLAWVAVCAWAIAAAQPAKQPQFTSGIAVLRLDASVVGDDGRAISNLTAQDFQVAIDGQPRKVVFARFTGAGGPLDTRAASAPSVAIPSFTANDRAGGRAIVLMVDLESINAGSERVLLETAAQLVEHLRPVDAVSVVPLPGQSLDLTRDHRKAAEAIRQLRGTGPTAAYEFSFTFEEALAFERRDQRVIAEVIERECRPEAGRAQRDLPQTCPPDLRRDTAERLRNERLHVEMVLTNLVTVARQLRNVPAPASIVLISGGFGFEQRSLGRFQDVQRALRENGISIATIQVDQPAVDASTSRPMHVNQFSSQDLQAGLGNLASMADGAFFAGIGTAVGVFDRLRTQLTEVYELGIEAEPGDLDGRPHEVRVTTTRKATVKARRYVASAAPITEWPVRLAALMAQPLDVGDLPIAVASHALRGDDPTTLKVLIRADLAHGIAATPPVRYSAVLFDAANVAVMNVTGTASAEGGVLLSTQLSPGRYRLRMAAIDGTGRAGTLEVPLSAGIRAGGGVQFSDVIIGTAATESLRPSIYTSNSDPVIPAVELSTDDASRFARTSVAFEIRREGSDDVVVAREGRLEPTAYERQQIARASVPTDSLAPGKYMLSAIIKVDDQAAGRVSRMFVIEAGRPRTTIVTASPPAPVPSFTTDSADPTVAELMRKVATYVAAYGEQMSGVVGVEKYTQYVTASSGSTIRPRQLVAEFALVKSGGLIPWTGYRDVIEVNGEPVRDRRDRILKILAESNNPIEEATRLTAESARFNIGPVSRNFNLPTTALFFFHESNLGRFAFTRKATRQIDGVTTLEIAFRETHRPTLITTRDGKDVPCEGSLWVLPGDGTIVRTRLQLRGFADSVSMGDSRPDRLPPPPAPAPPVATPPPSPAPGATQGASGGGASGVRGTGGDANRAGLRDRFAAIPEFSLTKLESTADIDVTYRHDPKLGIWLPIRMSEEYQGAIPRINTPPILGSARSTATYSEYKRFGTSAAVITPKK